MNPVYKQIKEELKDLGKKIRELKDERNTLFREGNFLRLGSKESQENYSKASTIQWKDLPEMKYEYRHKHIARCEMRGRTRDQIEKPSESNKPNEDYIKSIKESWTEKINEALRSDEKRLIA